MPDWVTRSGLGIVLYNDSNGNTRQRGSRISFAHHLTLDRYADEFLSFGFPTISTSLELMWKTLRTLMAWHRQMTAEPSTTTLMWACSIVMSSSFSVPMFPIFFPKTWSSSIRRLSRTPSETIMPIPDTLLPKRTRGVEIEPSLFFQWFENDGRSVTDLNAKFRWRDFEDYYYAGLTYRFLNDQVW